MKTASEIRIEKMRNGEKLQCPRCKDGYVSAVGNPLTTKVFKCDICGMSIVLTIVHTWKDGKLVIDDNKE